MTDPRTAIVAGATGLVGGLLVDQLLADSAISQIIVVTRRPTGRQHDKLTEIITDFSDLSGALTDVTADVAFCALGTTIKTAGSQAAFRAVDFDAVVNFATTAKACGVTAFCAVSSVGANPGSNNFYLRTKGETEDALRDLGFDALHLFRPSLLIGERDEFRLGERLGTLPMKVLSLLLLGPLRPYRAIDAKAVARSMIAAAQSEPSGTRLHTYADMM